MSLTLKVTLGPYYDAAAEQLDAQLEPVGMLEVLLAAQIVRAHWRLETCEKLQSADNPNIDRIRHRAELSIRRSMAEIRQLQADRHLKAELNLRLPGITRVKDVVQFASSKKRTHSEPAPDAIANAETRIAAVLAKEAELQATKSKIRSQTEPVIGRNTPCPCGSRAKFKRCCGKHAPPIYKQAA